MNINDPNDPKAVVAYVKKIIDAIDKRDHESIESLRTFMHEAHIPGVLATWRASLPWDAKDLYAMILMDQRDARIEPVMIDALAAPAVDTRSVAVACLMQSFALFSELHTESGWADPAKVDAAIAKYHATTGRGMVRCTGCGAPLKHAQAKCGFCGAGAQATADDHVFEHGGRFFELRTGRVPADARPGQLDLTPVFMPGVVSAKFGTLDGPFGTMREVLVKVVRHAAGAASIVKMGRHALAADATNVVLAWSLEDRGEYEIEVVGPDRAVLAQVPFRIV